MKRRLFFSFSFILLNLICFCLCSGVYESRVIIEPAYEIIPSTTLVLIAISDYQKQLNLKNPVNDAKSLKEELESHYYIDRTIELYNKEATKENIIKLFKKLIQNTNEKDNVIIFYAGHGELDEDSGTGFWIPYDGGLSRITQRNWLGDQQLRGYIKKMQARHILLISDACFSGSLVKIDRNVKADMITNTYFEKAYHRISRQVLTSGATEKVPDDSEFVFNLIQTLKRNKEPYIDPLILFSRIRLGMEKTIPLFGVLKETGHQEGGSFLLFLKEAYEEENRKLADSSLFLDPEKIIEEIRPEVNLHDINKDPIFFGISYSFLTKDLNMKEHIQLVQAIFFFYGFSFGLELGSNIFNKIITYTTLSGFSQTEKTSNISETSVGLCIYYHTNRLLFRLMETYGGITLEYPFGIHFTLGLGKTFFNLLNISIESRFIINSTKVENITFTPYGNAYVKEESVIDYFFRIGITFGVRL